MNKQSFDLSSLAPYAAPVGGAGIGGLLGYLLARDDEDSTPGLLGALGGAGLGAGAGYLANPHIQSMLQSSTEEPQVQGVTLDHKPDSGVAVKPTKPKTSGTKPNTMPPTNENPARPVDKDKLREGYNKGQTKQSNWEALSPYLPAAGGAGVGGLLGYLLARDDEDSNSGLLGALAGAGIGGAGAHFGLPYLQKLLNKPETADLSTPTTTQALNRVNPHLGTGVAAAAHMNEKALNDFNSNQVALGTAMAPGPYAAMASSPLSAAGRSANVVNGMVNKSLFNSVQ